MPRIALLEEAVINKIAAGEVVERPSAVVKELVENAIDAGANALTIEIKEGGFQLIRITDNGSGMEGEEIRNAFLRHATSKIRRVEDLQTVESLGFRGEALASIAAVSRTEAVTKTAGALFGTRYLIEGGREQGKEEIGCPEGTTVLVRDLFFNTPARKKFMKTPQTEASYIGDMVQYLALSHPWISFKYIQNGQMKLQTSGNGNRKEVIYSIFGRDITANLCEVDEIGLIGEDSLHITGYCGKPVITRGNRNLEMYFINGRYIKNTVVNQAVENAYKPYLMTRKYPFTALYLELPQHLVDVNVHPSKMEAQFGNREAVYELVERAISQALRQRELIPEVPVKPAGRKGKETPEKGKDTRGVRQERPLEPFEKRQLAKEKEDREKKDREEQEQKEEQGQKKKQEQRGTEERGKKEEKEKRNHDGKESFLRKEMLVVKETEPDFVQGEWNLPLLSKQARKQHRIIGQVFSTYWLVEFSDKLFIIDQHAAHEKVLYERNLQMFHEKKTVYSQMIAPPAVISLSMTEQQVVKENIILLQQVGFEIEPFGGNEYALRAVPADMGNLADREIFLEFLEALEKGQKTPEFILEKLAMISCKAAVKGRNKMKTEEVNALLDELLTLENPYHCPHGRPTIISMSRYELEKRFHRIV